MAQVDGLELQGVLASVAQLILEDVERRALLEPLQERRDRP